MTGEAGSVTGFSSLAGRTTCCFDREVLFWARSSNARARDADGSRHGRLSGRFETLPVERALRPRYAGIHPGVTFKQGFDMLQLRASSGQHHPGGKPILKPGFFQFLDHEVR